jgi:predicted RNA binding protein YcfA (HicA-like mRNA interferase family)
MNEAETRAELIDPALKAAGWGVVEASRVGREVITLGRLQGAGVRAAQDIADYVLICRNHKSGDQTTEAAGVTGQCVSLTLASPMCIMRIVKSTDLIRELNAAGWVLDRVRGSHHVFKHADRPGHIVVPHPKKDLGTGLVAAIRKQAGL